MGGQNGGSTSENLTPKYRVTIVFSVVDTLQGIDILNKAMISLAVNATVGAWIWFAVGFLVTLLAVFDYGTCIQKMTDYLEGDSEAGEDLLLMFWLNVIFKVVMDVLDVFITAFAEQIVATKIAKEFGSDFLNRMLLKMDDVFEIRDYVTLLKKADITDDVSKAFMEKYGKEGFSWFKRMKKHGISDTLLKKLLQVDDISLLSDDVMKAIMNSDGYVDDIIEMLNKYGDDAAKYIGKYGDEAAEVIQDYGDEAIAALKDGKTPEEIKSGSNTIWDDITATADNIPGTEIPATFQIELNANINYVNPETGTNTLWTNANATKHMGEYISRFGEESWSIGTRSQAMLESYSASLNKAMEELILKEPGRHFGKYGNWELGINTEIGVVYHALMVD